MMLRQLAAHLGADRTPPRACVPRTAASAAQAQAKLVTVTKTGAARRAGRQADICAVSRGSTLSLSTTQWSRPPGRLPAATADAAATAAADSKCKPMSVSRPGCTCTPQVASTLWR